MTVRLKPLLVNAALAIVSTLVAYTLMEYALFRVLLPEMPLGIRPHLPDVADVLTQNSKADYLPHDYIALLGDSYAEGLGEWLVQAKGDRAKPFHSANVIQELTGRDVVTFGKSGAGSAEAIVLRPARIFPESRCSVFPAIERPRQMFIYFYEGNDMEDNVNFLLKVRERYGRYDADAIDRYLADVYGASYPWHCHLQLLDTAIRMAQFLYQYYLGRIDIAYCGHRAPHANRIVAGGRTVEAPPLLGPAPALRDEHILLGMDVLARSLHWLRHRFEDVPITVVYVPGPLSVYRLAGENASYCISYNIGSVPGAKVERNSDFMAGRVREIAAEQGVSFLDARPALRAAASVAVIHGPIDWDHLDEAGYRVLGKLVASHVDKR